MKSYLQRMAEQAVRPQNGIHPMVGSIYAGQGSSGPRQDADSLEREERMLMQPKNPPIESEATRSVSQPASVQWPRERAVESDTSPRSQAQHAAIASAVFTPLVNSVPGEAMPAPSSHDAMDAPPAIQVQAAQAKERPPLDSSSNAGLLLPRAEAPRLVTVEKHYSERVAGIKDEERDSGPIEIHIGRIEVTALPETPRPAPAARPRKSLDLGQYLKRRDGRTG